MRFEMEKTEAMTNGFHNIQKGMAYQLEDQTRETKETP